MLLAATLSTLATTMSDGRKTRWGILGTGTIASDFARILSHSSDSEIAAAVKVRIRQTFCERCDLADAARHGSYDALLADASLDIVYIATPSARATSRTRSRASRRATPCSAKNRWRRRRRRRSACWQSRRRSASSSCTAYGRATFRRWRRCATCWPAAPSATSARRHARSGRTTAPARARRSPRRASTARNLLWVFGPDAPPTVRGVSYDLNEGSGLDQHVAALLEFPGGRTATFECSLCSASPRTATICGTKGVIRVAYPFWCPTSFTVQTMTGPASQQWGEEVTHTFPLPEVPARSTSSTRRVWRTRRPRRAAACARACSRRRPSTRPSASE